MDYQGWNSAIFEQRVLTRVDSDSRLYLYVDPAILAELIGISDVQAAVADFTDAIAAWDGDPFRYGLHCARKWKANSWSGEPAFVAVLALTVLAVTMDAIGAKHGVYPRQNQLLNRPALPQAPEGYEECVPAMWRIWNEWLEGPGCIHGRPSARAMGHFRIQGWARSQGLIRQVDREVIADFLDSIRPRRNGPKSSRLNEEFRVWLTHRGQRGQDLLTRCLDDDFAALLSEVLEDESLAWTGVRQDRARGLAARALLSFDELDGGFEVLLPVRDNVIGRELDLGCGIIEVTSSMCYLPVTCDESIANILANGTQRRFSDLETIRVGGRDIYLFEWDAAEGRFIEARPESTAEQYDLLVPTRREAEVQALLQDLGLSFDLGNSPVTDWRWIHDVPTLRDVSEEDTLRLWHMGLGLLAPGERANSELVGGLQVAPSKYLSGFEPDVVLATGVTQFRFDGVPFEASTGVFKTWETIPEPGVHTVEAASKKLRFETVAYVRRTMHSSRAGWVISRQPASVKFVKELPALAPTSCGIQGSRISSTQTSSPPRVVSMHSHERLIAAHRDGALFFLKHNQAGWMSRLDVTAAYIDLTRATQSLGSDFVAIMIWDTARSTVRIFQVPSQSVEADGYVTRAAVDSESRSMILLSDWTWPDGMQLKSLKTLILGAPVPVDTPALSPRTSTKLTRSDALARARARLNAQVESGSRHSLLRHNKPLVLTTSPVDNPYDDILGWLSELETSEVSLKGFEETWRWLCDRAGVETVGKKHLEALRILESLGHVEVDWKRKRVCVAPAALVALPASDGLRMLTGSRPAEAINRLEAMDDPELEEAQQFIDAHPARTPISPDGVPLGPLVRYLECDPNQRVQQVVVDALEALNIHPSGVSATDLLFSLPTLRELVRDGEKSSVSLSPRAEFLTETPGGRARWQKTESFTESGLYKFTIRGVRRYAWLDSQTSGFAAVDVFTGLWLHRQVFSNGSHIFYDLDWALLVRGSTRLPPLIERALVMRTGFPPYQVEATTLRTSGSLARSAFAEEALYVFENVGAATKDRVATLLGQEIPPALDVIEKVWS